MRTTAIDIITGYWPKQLRELMRFGAGLLTCLALVVTAASIANASCKCVCVDGQAKAVCSSPFDVAPICPLTTCSVAPSPVEPNRPIESSASCKCVCVEGQVRTECRSSLDVKPICPIETCPIALPSIEPVQPLQPPSYPPIGTSNCVQAQMLNEKTNKYEWKESCY